MKAAAGCGASYAPLFFGSERNLGSSRSVRAEKENFSSPKPAAHGWQRRVCYDLTERVRSSGGHLTPTRDRNRTEISQFPPTRKKAVRRSGKIDKFLRFSEPVDNGAVGRISIFFASSRSMKKKLPNSTRLVPLLRVASGTFSLRLPRNVKSRNPVSP